MKTAFVYDPFNLKHTRHGHPENYRRLEGTWALLQQSGITDRLHRVPSDRAPLEAIHAVHTPTYVERVCRLCEQGGGNLDPDTYVNEFSYEAALRAAGGLMNVVDAVLGRAADNGFALVRPPGHHARPSRGMGFCLFGNIAIAARHAQKKHGVGRVLIVDFDVHHGNGTQEMFYEDDSVLFFSTHQYPYYPGSGAVDEIGAGAGRGYTVNVPFPPGIGDQGYRSAFQDILIPMARHFRPELILVSAGFDAHWMDPLAGEQLSITGFGQLVTDLLGLAAELCDGKLVCTLEGGYNLDVLPHCVLSVLRLLKGDPEGISDPFGPSPRPERDASQRIHLVRKTHSLA